MAGAVHSNLSICNGAGGRLSLYTQELIARCLGICQRTAQQGYDVNGVLLQLAQAVVVDSFVMFTGRNPDDQSHPPIAAFRWAQYLPVNARLSGSKSGISNFLRDGGVNLPADDMT